MFSKARTAMASISSLLRRVESYRVLVQPFADILWLYANIETYFTPNDSYKKWVEEDVEIRKCDVKEESKEQNQLDPQQQEKVIYKGNKEYDPSYIWGQLVGWYKQTVDKPNASLSAERRGTLSMPDLESFITTVSKEESKKRKKKGPVSILEEGDQFNEESGNHKPIRVSNR